VVVDTDEYRQRVAGANAASIAVARAQSLKALQLKYDKHLASLNRGSLTKAVDRPARRGNKLTVGKSL